ncbi:hypothetical protein ACH5RR_021770 [Cinchona calisaya]|uniref:TF-B3 domain-containing protein n=1 Tax=Cinchona calisaya TaxID=153742 RepID=A0ABD2ZIA8_9GENT
MEEVLSFRRRPRKSSHPRRALMNSIQDQFRFSPSIEKSVLPVKKSSQSIGKRSIVRVARSNSSSISLPNRLDDQAESFLKEKLTSKESSEKLNSEVKTGGQRKIKITLKKKDQEINTYIDDGVEELQQKEEENSTNDNACPPLEQQHHLPVEFKNYIEELGATGDPVLVIQKILFPSDVESGLQRLLIPVKKVVNQGFLTEEERSIFNRHNKTEINAILIGTSVAHQFAVKLKKWYMGKTETYALVSGWKEVVKRNGLKPGQLVQLWSFKKASQLYFALVRLQN